MILDAVRLTVDWLTDGTTGVNALRTSVPQDGGEADPPAVTVKSVLTDAWVAREEIDAGVITAPFLLVSPFGETVTATYPALDRSPKPVVEVAIRYAAPGPDSKTIGRDAWLTLRCVQRSVSAKQTSTLTSHSKNQAQFDVPGFRYVPLYQVQADALVIGGAILSFPASDPWALATT
jgi:hypothetical protein